MPLKINLHPHLHIFALNHYGQIWRHLMRILKIQIINIYLSLSLEYILKLLITSKYKS